MRPHRSMRPHGAPQLPGALRLGRRYAARACGAACACPYRAAAVWAHPLPCKWAWFAWSCMRARVPEQRACASAVPNALRVGRIFKRLCMRVCPSRCIKVSFGLLLCITKSCPQVQLRQAVPPPPHVPRAARHALVALCRSLWYVRCTSSKHECAERPRSESAGPLKFAGLCALHCGVLCVCESRFLCYEYA